MKQLDDDHDMNGRPSLNAELCLYFAIFCLPSNRFTRIAKRLIRGGKMDNFSDRRVMYCSVFDNLASRLIF